MGKRKGRKPTVKSRSGPAVGGGGDEPPPVSEAETEAEGESDFCFLCKDGGDLRLCDFRNCHKAYHAHCVGKGEDFLKSDDEFFCMWHTCFICQGRSYYRCRCCPGNSVCRGCLRQAEFGRVGTQIKGFCNNCLRMAIMIEKNIEVDSDGEKVDFSDKSTYEFLFKDYWEIVKEKEGLALDNLQEAHSSLDNSPNCNHVSDSENFPKEHSSDDDFSDNIDDVNDEPIRLSNVNGASNKVKALRKQGKSKKNVYVGWGSKELIEFLALIGKDASVSLDQFGAAEVVKEYIRQKHLLQKDKKKYVICDAKLWPLFRKQKIKFTKIYSLLERHIAANATSEDETLASSEDNSDSFRKKKTRTMTSDSTISKEISERIRKCFASLIRDNIKLIYLRRSLVMDLLKQPEAFENKVIGCFVRVKNDPKDYKNSRSTTMYQLGQVTGIRKSSEEYMIRNSISTNMMLCVSSCWSEVKISMLSDEDFEEDECEHLRLMAKKENSERKTVAEFEVKARNVHRDIVSHWIDRELQRLEKLIEVANEKGWRYEMHEYIEKRRLLSTASERQRLLEEVPRVIPDLEDNKDAELLIAASDKSLQINTSVLQGTNGERAVCLESCSEEISKGAHGERAVCLETCSEEISKGADEERTPCLKSCSEDKSEGANEKALRLKRCLEEKYEGVDDKVVSFKSWPEENPKATEADANTPEMCVQNQAIAVKSNAAGDTPRTYVQNQDSEDNAAGDRLGMHVQKQCAEAGITAEVINIDDDDEDDAVHDEGSNISVADLDADKSQDTRTVQHETKHTGTWYYMDPQGDQQGPFQIELLRGWKEAGFFDDGFRVWRAGESSETAILLTDALLLKR